MEYGLAKKIRALAHANHDPYKQEDWIQFCMKRLRTLKSFKIFKIAVDVLLKGFPMIPLACRSNLAGRCFTTAMAKIPKLKNMNSRCRRFVN
jgi:hypothetical protein